ncbi:MAG TPA: glycosyltransferase family 4 protein, partial [Devosia sp.]|nr:glycosyltransferase family 4 protein [Devosia sp.]
GLVRLIYRSVDLILVQSRSFVVEIERQAGGNDKIGYFPSWSDDPASAVPAEPAPEVPAANGQFSIMFTGNVGDAQDFPAILDTAELMRHEPVRWLIVGDGRRSDWLAAEVARRNLGDCVLLLGRHPLERMPSFLVHADAALVALRPEPAFAMTIPGKVQTYLAAGKPILGMIDGEGAEVIRLAGAGFTAPAGDAPAFADAIRRMMATPADQRLEMGRGGQEFARAEFDRDTLVARLEKWLEQLVNRDRTRRAVGRP